MIDKTITDLVQDEIVKSVNQYVGTVLADQAWQDQIEKRITRYVQDRIAARFANIADIPGLVSSVETSVATLFKKGLVPNLDQFINKTALETTIDSAVQVLVQSTISNLVVDKSWIEKIETMVNQHMVTKLTDKISGIDLNKLLTSQIDQGITRWQERLKKDFKTAGITDVATSCQLTVIDDAVVATNGIAGQSLLIEKDTDLKGTTTINNLILRGTINTDNRSWNELANKAADQALTKLTNTWKEDLVADVLNLAKTQGIQFDTILLYGAPLIKNDELNTSIKRSSLEHTGKLTNLATTGVTNLSDTVTVKGKRVGINTDDPEMVLSVWDEEVSLIAGKISKDRAFVGTARNQAVTIGVNRKPHIEIDTDGLVTVKNFRIDRWKISHATEVPGYSGTRGDFVLNSDPKPESAFAWVCLGGFRWQPLKSM